MALDYTEILTDIRKIVRSVNLESKRIQKEYGISIPQLLCLSYLRKKERNTATHGQIAKALNLNSSTITGIIDRLSKKGYVVKLSRAEDKRIHDVVLTAAGSDILTETPSLIHEKLAKKLADLPDEKIIRIKESLHEVIQLLDIDDIEEMPYVLPE